MSITLDEYQVTLEFLRPLLGTVPLNVDTFKEHVAAPEVDPDVIDEEAEGIEEVERPGWTGFLKHDDGAPYISGHMVKGFFKETCQGLRRNDCDTISKKIPAYRKAVDQHVFILPHEVDLRLPDGQDILRATDYQTEELDATLLPPNKRPLRGQTQQGERISIARSESAPTGTEVFFTVLVIQGSAITEPVLREWLDYGQLKGLGQWRNAGYGAFGYELTKIER